MFNAIRASFSQVLALAERLVEAVEGILGRLEWVGGTIKGLGELSGQLAGDSQSPRIEALEAKVTELTLAVDTGVQRVQRSENRIRAVVDGARRQLEEAGFEHPGVEAEAAQLHLGDGATRDQEPVPPVHQEVEEDSDLPSSIPGVTRGELRRAQRMH